MTRANALALLIWLAVSAPSRVGTAAPDRRLIDKALATMSDRQAWHKYWLPGTFNAAWVQGKRVTVIAVFSPSALAVCVRAVAVCELYSVTNSNDLGILAEWDPSSMTDSIEQQAASVLSQIRVPVASGMRPRQPVHPRSFDPDHIALPDTKQPPQQFDERLEVEWTLRAALQPSAVATRRRPENAEKIRAAALRLAHEYVGGCKTGRLQIPFFASTDPRIFVFLGSGGKCKDGVLEFVNEGRGTFVFSRYVVNPSDVRFLSQRIQPAVMITIDLNSGAVRNQTSATTCRGGGGF